MQRMPYLPPLTYQVGRMLTALFPQVPEFEGRAVATFHNQRDYIFFRRHRYIFRNKEKCGLQELGPRFTVGDNGDRY
jgi:ribosome production factor 1